MAEEALASLGALPLTRTRLMTWPPRLRVLSNIAFRSGSVEFSCTAGTRATGPSATEALRFGIALVTSGAVVQPLRIRTIVTSRFMGKIRVFEEMKGDGRRSHIWFADA